MVKYPLPKHPSRSELRALVKEAMKLGLDTEGAFAWAMLKLNSVYNRKTRGVCASPWKKPPGFDSEWWNGKLLRVRLGVKPTKQEAKRAREKRARFMEMVRRAERDHTLVAAHPRCESSRADADVVPRAFVCSTPLIKRRLLFSAFPSEEEANIEELLGGARETVVQLSLGEMGDPEDQSSLDEWLDSISNEDSPTPDMGFPTSCAHSDKCLSVILSAKNV